ncbi:hypothetical protein DUHN55_30660 [Helicobacter pylori]
MGEGTVKIFSLEQGGDHDEMLGDAVGIFLAQGAQLLPYAPVELRAGDVRSDRRLRLAALLGDEPRAAAALGLRVTRSSTALRTASSLGTTLTIGSVEAVPAVGTATPLRTARRPVPVRATARSPTTTGTAATTARTAPGTLAPATGSASTATIRPVRPLVHDINLS